MACDYNSKTLQKKWFIFTCLGDSQMTECLCHTKFLAVGLLGVMRP